METDDGKAAIMRRHQMNTPKHEREQDEKKKKRKIIPKLGSTAQPVDNLSISGTYRMEIDCSAYGYILGLCLFVEF